MINMETMTILEHPATLNRDYNEEADVFSLTAGEPRPPVGIDNSEGLIVRFDHNEPSVAGLMVIGLRARMLQALASSSIGP